MSFANVFQGIDFQAPNRARQAEANRLQQAIGQGIAMYERAQDRDMRRRQFELREAQGQGLNLERQATEAIYKQQMGAPLSETDIAAIRAQSVLKAPSPYLDPVTQQFKRPETLAQRAGLDQAPQSRIAQVMRPSMPVSAPTAAPVGDGMPMGGQVGSTPLPSALAGTPRGELERFKELKEISKEQRAFENKKAFVKFQNEAKSSMAQKKKNEGRAEFERQLGTVLKDLDELKEQGGAISEDQGFLGRFGAMAAEAPFVGRSAQALFDPETQTLRDKIDGKRPALFNSIKKASGLTGGELNSQFEVENQLKQLGNPSMTYEARRALLQDLSNTFGTGELSAGAGEDSSSVPSDGKPQKRRKFNPDTGRLE